MDETVKSLDILDSRQKALSLLFKAFRCSPHPITISTFEDGRFIEVNDGFVKLSGYGRDEVIGRTAFELNIWVDKSEGLKLIQELQVNGFVRDLEVEYRLKSGKLINALIYAEIIDLDHVPHILVFHHDITARKQGEKQLILSAQRDRLLTETLARIRSSLDLEQILQTTVQEVRQFLQVDRVFIGLNNPKVGTKAIAESVDPQYPSVLGWTTNDQKYIQELRNMLTTNRVRVVEDTTQIEVSPKLKEHYQKFQIRASLAVPIMQGKELFGGLIANQCGATRHWHPIEIDLLQQMSEQLAIAIQQSFICQELAELNANLELQVEERTAQLQQKMQELEGIHRIKDVVLHTIAHDLRTAAMGNVMVLKTLLKDKSHGVAGEESSIPIPCSILQRMIQGNDRQLAMIDSLLEIHSCEGKGIVLQCQRVNFSQLLEIIFQDLQPLLSQNQAILKNCTPENLPLVMVDATQLQKVLGNLITYRLQHNPPGLNFTLTAKVEGGMICTQIQDNGVQMSKIDCDRLFDLYVRDPKTLCSTDIALKMYLGRQIIESHGGEVGVISNHPHGLTFWFTLPLEESGFIGEKGFV